MAISPNTDCGCVGALLAAPFFVLAGPDGIFMVDSQYLQIGDNVLAAIRRIDSGPIRFLVNTHIHGERLGNINGILRTGRARGARPEVMLQITQEVRE